MTNRGRVTVQIAGGLGNQLFQYATARRLSLRSGVPLVLDHLSGFARDFYQRRYLLDRFAVRGDTIEPRSAYVSHWGRLRRSVRVWQNRSRDLADQTYIREDDTRFDPRIVDLKVTRPIYLEGYWQYERYFSDIRETLCDELTLRTPHDPDNVEVAERIRSLEAVCLHVRRLHGVPNTADARPVMDPSWKHFIDPSYFQNAVERMAQQVENPHFFVFADYPDWAKEHIRAPYPIEFVTHNGAERDYEDFWLMTQCRHFIVANSTFSWWAAWLAQHPDKVVIAPRNAIGQDQVLKSAPDSWLLV
jgi:Glycosyl transferase family 11